MLYNIEPEIQDGQRAFNKTQELFTGTPRITGLKDPIEVSWYGTEISPYRGAFCVVQEGAGYSSLVGEFVRVLPIGAGSASVVVYCLAETPEIDTAIALTRRAFAEIDVLPTSSRRCSVQIVD